MSLGKDDDFTVFLKRGVPELLRKTALRKLWRTDPVFANVDGLNDYDEDFRNPAHSVYKSLWQVGRGFLTQGEQQAQHDSGRLSQPVEEEAAEGNAEAVTPRRPRSPKTSRGAAERPAGRAPVAALEADRGSAENADTPKDQFDRIRRSRNLRKDGSRSGAGLRASSPQLMVHSAGSARWLRSMSL